MSTPIAFLVFNRPETTVKVFEAIRRARPPKLLVVADGPRPDRPGDAERCSAVRAIIEGVDWPCEVKKNYSETNLGCRQRISSGLDWVFSEVEETIILEDDCLPHPTFFRYCEELLARYRCDARVAMVSGNNFQFGRKRTEHSYYCSRHPHIWGWASWRRVWRNYDVGMALWPEIRDGGWLTEILSDSGMASYWARVFERTYRGEIDTWDHQLTFSLWINSGLCILPNVNLVSNIGFGNSATNTQTLKSPFAAMPTFPMEFPLRQPPFMIADAHADRFEFDTIYRPRLAFQARYFLKSLLRG